MTAPQKRTPGCSRASAETRIEHADSSPPAEQTDGLHAAHVETRASHRRLFLALDRCNSFTRLEALIQLSFKMDRDDWLVALGQNWSCCDNVWRFRTVLQRLLPPTGPVSGLMTAQEQEAYAALPAILTVYRGCGARNMLGASWSLDKGIAARFPFMNRYRTPHPRLVTATVPKRDVLAVKLDREETEIITFKARRTQVEALPEHVERRQ